MSNEGIQCDQLNGTDVTEELPNVNFTKMDTHENAESGVDLVCDNQDVDDVLDDALDFDIIEEEPGYNQTMLVDKNYQPDTDQDTDTGTETETETEKETDGQESSSTKCPRS